VDSKTPIVRYPFTVKTKIHFLSIFAEYKKGVIDKEGSPSHCGRPSTALHPDDPQFFQVPKFILFPTASRFEGRAIHANV
jgi:hypothetical protein